MSTLLRFTEGYFLSSKGDTAHVINVAADDSVVFQFTGTAKKIVEKIYGQTSYQEALAELERLHPEQGACSNEAFLQKFLADLKSLGVLYNGVDG